MPECLCGHRADYHHQFGTKPCGYGGCLCKVYVQQGQKPKEPVKVRNLFGELQAVPDHTD